MATKIGLFGTAPFEKFTVEKLYENVAFGLWGDRTTTHANIIYCIIFFPFLAHTVFQEEKKEKLGNEILILKQYKKSI